MRLRRGARRHRRKRQLKISLYLDRDSRKILPEKLLHLDAIFFAAGACKSRAYCNHFDRDSRAMDGRLGSFGHSRECRRKTDARGIRRRPRGAADNFASFVHNNALGLAAAAVNSQHTLHVSSLREEWSVNMRRYEFVADLLTSRNFLDGRWMGFYSQPFPNHPWNELNSH